MRETDVSNFVTVINKDKVLVPTNIMGTLISKPKWDIYENNHFAMRKRLVNIFLKNSNKLITIARAKRRLIKMKKFFE
jgi:hypothetical protein